jgi:hypothetical protein
LDGALGLIYFKRALVVFNLHWSAQLPREGCYFCLDTKVTKKSSQQGGFFALNALPCKAGTTTGCNYFALLRPLIARASAKTCYAIPSRKATIVLPAFVRSLPADERSSKTIRYKKQDKIEKAKMGRFN